MYGEPVVYNPKGLPTDDLPVIFGYNAGRAVSYSTDVVGKLISEDGVELGQHHCSSTGFMYGDLGITNPHSTRHKKFKEHYPDGYKMEFISGGDFRLKRAFERAEYDKETADASAGS